MNWTLLFGIVAGLLSVWLLLVVLLWAFRPRDASLGELLRVVPDIARLVRGLLGDRAVPFDVKALLVVLLLWLLSPIDLVPEFVPILGPLDDVVVAILVLRYVRRRLGSLELQRRWPGTPEGWRLLARIVGAGAS